MRQMEMKRMRTENVESIENGALAGTGLGMGVLLPLWLTETEADAVLALCASAPAEAGPGVEASLFGKLGQLLRAFRC